MVNKKITIDSVEYDVLLEFGSLGRSFEIVQGKNAGVAIPGNDIQDILGTRYSYTVRILPRLKNADVYDALWEVLSAPVESHQVSFPYGQTVISFAAKVVSGADTFMGQFAGKNRWSGVTVTFVPIAPQRVPT